MAKSGFPKQAFKSALLEVRTFWNWASYRLDRGKTPCLINMDETSIARPAKARGCLCPATMRPKGLPPRRPRSPGGGRQTLTQFMIISNIPAVQARLPHIFIGNGRSLPKKDLRALTVPYPCRVEFWRGKSGWNDASKMKQFLSRLADVFVLEFPDLEPVLFMDAASCHLGEGVALHAANVGVRLVVVPARCTMLVQPCDTHVLSAYKRFVNKLYHGKLAPSRDLSTQEWLLCLCEAVHKFVNSLRWESSFAETGIMPGDVNLTCYLKHLEVDRLNPPELPSYDSVRKSYPRNFAHVPYNLLFLDCLGVRDLE